MGFSMTVWAQGYRIPHSVFATICETDNMMNLKIWTRIRRTNKWYRLVAPFALSRRSLEHFGCHLRITNEGRDRHGNRPWDLWSLSEAGFSPCGAAPTTRGDRLTELLFKRFDGYVGVFTNRAKPNCGLGR